MLIRKKEEEGGGTAVRKEACASAIAFNWKKQQPQYSADSLLTHWNMAEQQRVR
jgi:hypothetical protein